MPARSQSCVAVSADGERWFLVNASPDLRGQIEGFEALHPERGVSRSSRIEGVLLTNADLDHVLGLFLLREGARLDVHAIAAVRDVLSSALRLDAVLATFCEFRWHDPPTEFAPLCSGGGSASGLAYRAIRLPGAPPRFYEGAPSLTDRDSSPGRNAHSVAFQFRGSAEGPRLLVAPDVAAMTPEFEQALRESDAVLIDGTFWHDDELRALVPDARTSNEMGHLPISGPEGTLAVLRGLPTKRRIYIHINNTNPVLRPGSRERVEVEAAGVQVGEDGMEFEL
jgi:pyrroloquinoline quinone biosynthesis protein B